MKGTTLTTIITVTKAEFLRLAQNVHGNTYDYSKLPELIELDDPTDAQLKEIRNIREEQIAITK